MKLQARVIAVIPLVLLAALLFMDRSRRHASPPLPPPMTTTVAMAHARSAAEMTRHWSFPGAKTLMSGVTSPMAVIRTDTTPHTFEEVRDYYARKVASARPETQSAKDADTSSSPDTTAKAATFHVQSSLGMVVVHVTRGAGDKATKITLTAIPSPAMGQRDRAFP